MTTTQPAPFFLAQPSVGTAGHPAVVVIMEGNGMSQQLLRVCQRLAHEGYTAIAPDLFHRFGGSDGDKAMAEGWYAKMKIDEGLARIERRTGEGDLGDAEVQNLHDVHPLSLNGQE